MQDDGQISTQKGRSVKWLLGWRGRSWYGMTQILPYLYLGSICDANDVEQLREKQIDHVVSLHELSGRTGSILNELNILRIHMADMPEANISEHFAETATFIHRARLLKKSVLVHCIAGVSRSVCIVAAYLIAACDMSYAASLAYIVSKRPCANPNFGFRMQLAKYAGKRSSLDGIMMRSQFGSEAFDELKANDKMLLCDFSAASPLDTPDELTVYEDNKPPSPNTSIKKGCVEYEKCQNNPANRSILNDADINFIDQ
ncbi:dual specificity phosphatase [Loa loa]|uniref:Dual specificity phosphatase n=1 Tax=Loa loa TaxID=7209 RepID=A0A1I7VS52_LOALO|nr:dual specificity phosphatase [Loa loa]EFO18643.1 dual specificity phosphatase [Loa loa]